MSAPLHDISPILRNVLVCPLDHGSLFFDKEKQILTCDKCKKQYFVEKGIPNMLT
ncbi:MAG: Trm112 family protein [Candidatus Diapherotrites archaeon]